MRFFGFYVFLFFLFSSPTLFSQCAFTIEPVASSGCMHSESEAVFTDLVHTSFDGNTVKKTSGNSNWNAGALSTAGVWNGGYAETVISQTFKTRLFGLSHSNSSNQGINGVEYAIVLNWYGLAEIRESGSYRSFIGSFSTGDNFKIAVDDGVVNYYMNGELIYESSTGPTLPLYVDLAFKDNNAEISDVVIANTTGTTIRATTNQSPSGINSYNWYKNNTLLAETGHELNLSTIANGDIITCTATPTSGACAGNALHSNAMVLSIEASSLADVLTISNLPTDQGCYLAEETVSWRANIPDNFEIDGSTITKTQGYSTSDGGIFSTNTVSNNGYLEVQIGENTSSQMIGLSAYDAGQSQSTIQFAFYIGWGGSLRVYEEGSWRGQFGNISTDDTLRIAVENQVVKYYMNGALLYVSDDAPSLPLIVDGTISFEGSSFKNTRIANPTQGVFTATTDGASVTEYNWKRNGLSIGETSQTLTLGEWVENDVITCSYISTQAGCGNFEIQSNTIKIIPNRQVASPRFYIDGIVNQSGIGMAKEEVVWNPSSLENVSNIDNDLTKVQGYNQFNAGASSLNTVKNNGYVAFKITETNKRKAIGLSSTDLNYSYNTTDYAFLLSSNGRFTIYESGSWRMGNQPFAMGDILRIAVEDNTVKYYQNQTLVYASNITPTLPLLVDVALSSEGGTVRNAVVGNPNNSVFMAHLTGLGDAPQIEWNVNGNPTGINSNPLIYPSINNEDIITCTVVPDYSGCSATSTLESNIIQFFGPITLTNWLGGLSSDWGNPANWSNGVPTPEVTAKIPGGRPHQPELSVPGDAKHVLVEPQASLSITNGTSLRVYGDFLIDGAFDAGSGTVAFNGNESRIIDGDNLVFNSLVVNLSNPVHAIEIQSNISIAKEIIFIRGKIKTRNYEVIYRNGSLSRAGNPESFIAGKARKIGNTAFLFPVGADQIYAPIEISAPQSPTDAFTAEYIHADPNQAGFNTNSQDGSLSTISTCEYWILNRVNGNSPLRISLSYENTRSCGIADPSYLQVTHWNGTEWENKGLDSFSGDSLRGTITSLLPIDDFSPFTIGSLSGINPLPIELSSFSIEKTADHKVKISWTTHTEINNDFFTLERSVDAVHYTAINNVHGAGTSHRAIEYDYVDENPKAGMSYYRLLQTDFDGIVTYFDARSIYFDAATKITLYPNPNSGTFTIQRMSDSRVKLRLSDTYGRIVWSAETQLQTINVENSNLSKGLYFLDVDDGRNKITKKVIVR